MPARRRTLKSGYECPEAELGTYGKECAPDGYSYPGRGNVCDCNPKLGLRCVAVDDPAEMGYRRCECAPGTQLCPAASRMDVVLGTGVYTADPVACGTLVMKDGTTVACLTNAETLAAVNPRYSYQ